MGSCATISAIPLPTPYLPFQQGFKSRPIPDFVVHLLQYHSQDIGDHVELGSSHLDLCRVNRAGISF